MEERGEPIAGSNLVREFCKERKQPMRVAYIAKKEEDRPLCLDCLCIRLPPSGTGQVYRQQVKRH